MAWQLLYTSAPRLLAAGQTGFGTVARHRDLSALAVREIERISQFSREPGLPARRLVLSHRIVQAGPRQLHVLSAIRDAGADYTGRTNYLAHHLIADPREIAALGSGAATPADILLAFPWEKNWQSEPRFLDTSDEIDLASLPTSDWTPASTWQHITGSPEHASSLALTSHPRGLALILPANFDGDGTHATRLFAESLSWNADSPWRIQFTTELEPTDDRASLQLVGLTETSPLLPALADSQKVTRDLRHPGTLPAASKKFSPAKLAVPSTPSTLPPPPGVPAAAAIFPPEPQSQTTKSAPTSVPRRKVNTLDDLAGKPNRTLPILIGATVAVILLAAAAFGWMYWQETQTKDQIRQYFEHVDLSGDETVPALVEYYYQHPEPGPAQLSRIISQTNQALSDDLAHSGEPDHPIRIDLFEPEVQRILESDVKGLEIVKKAEDARDLLEDVQFANNLKGNAVDISAELINRANQIDDTYADQFFRETHFKAQEILNALTQLINQQSDETGAKNRDLANRLNEEWRGHLDLRQLKPLLASAQPDPTPDPPSEPESWRGPLTQFSSKVILISPPPNPKSLQIFNPVGKGIPQKTPKEISGNFVDPTGEICPFSLLLNADNFYRDENNSISLHVKASAFTQLWPIDISNLTVFSNSTFILRVLGTDFLIGNDDSGVLFDEVLVATRSEIRGRDVIQLEDSVAIDLMDELEAAGEHLKIELRKPETSFHREGKLFGVSVDGETISDIERRKIELETQIRNIENYEPPPKSPEVTARIQALQRIRDFAGSSPDLQIQFPDQTLAEGSAVALVAGMIPAIFKAEKKTFPYQEIPFGNLPIIAAQQKLNAESGQLEVASELNLINLVNDIKIDQKPPNRVAGGRRADWESTSIALSDLAKVIMTSAYPKGYYVLDAEAEPYKTSQQRRPIWKRN